MFNLLKGRKGAAFNELWQAALGLGIFSLVLVLVAYMVDHVQDEAEEEFGTTSAAYNVTVEALDALDLMSDWQTIVVIAVIMIVLISLILNRLGYLG